MDTCGGKMKNDNDIPYLTTSEVNERIGFTLTSKFIVEKLKVKPIHCTKTSYLWEDVNEIRIKLAKYLIDSVNKEEPTWQDIEKGRYNLA
jgi:hypothetical protein